MSVNKNRVRVDLDALAKLVVQDRGAKTQREYGEGLGLSQAQISAIELGKMRRLSADVADALRRRLGDLPSAGGGTTTTVRESAPTAYGAQDRDVEQLTAHARREFANLL